MGNCALVKVGFSFIHGPSQFTRATPGSFLVEYILLTGEASCVTVSSARGTGGNVGVNFKNLQPKQEGEKDDCNVESDSLEVARSDH